MDVVGDVEQTETYLTTLRAREMANTNSANSSESTAKMIPVLKKPKLKGKTF